MTSLDELRFWIHNQRSAAKNILDPHAMLAGRPVGVTERETAQSVLEWRSSPTRSRQGRSSSTTRQRPSERSSGERARDSERNQPHGPAVRPADRRSIASGR
jgi:hypothetical protein